MANIKAAFYDVINQLKKNSRFVSKRLYGSACESWLRTEICAILNFESKNALDSSRQEYVYGEVEKRDISIYKGYNETSNLLHHIELKVVYPGYSLAPKAAWLTSLKDQLERRKKPSEPKSVNRHGWVFSIWTSYYENILPQNFFVEVSKSLLGKFGTENYTSQHNYCAESILDSKISWRGEERQIIMKGIYFSKRNTYSKGNPP